jgi:hypothetical protein
MFGLSLSEFSAGKHTALGATRRRRKSSLREPALTLPPGYAKRGTPK